MKKLVALLLTFFLLLTGCSTVEITKVEDDIKTDNIRFSGEYKNISKDNLFEYSTYNNVMETLQDKTGIIYLGFPTCVLCNEIVTILNEAATEKDVKSILYYNFKDIRDNNTREYQTLATVLSEYIKADDEGNKRISAPTVIFVNKGNIVGIYIGTITSDTEELITEEQKENLKQNFKGLIDKMRVEQTTTKEAN